MFAVIKTGGKQYRVEAGQVLDIEKLVGEPGAKIAFDDVLLVGDGAKTTVGSPNVKGAAVDAEIVAQHRDDKVIIIKKRRRKGYQRKKGHRQHLTAVKITGIRAA